MKRLAIVLFALLTTWLATFARAEPADELRFATFNVAMGLGEQGELARRLKAGDDPALRALAEIVQRIRPDVLLLNEFDYDPDYDAAADLVKHYLSRPVGDLRAIDYAFSFSAEVNTGVASGLDIDGNGRLGDPGDAWGFGRFPGQYGMLILSRYPIDADSVRTFQEFLWRDMPGALRPGLPNEKPFYDDRTWARLRLSSKSHWDLPVVVGSHVIHLLASHPTPPVFDGPEDRNGRRNHDEIRFWADYVSPGSGDYLYDDQGHRGGLAKDARFIVAGDLNADPHDGDATGRAIAQLLEHERINSDCTPLSAGAVEAALAQGGRNAAHTGDPAADTGDMNDERVGNLRIDYVLPSVELEVTGCGVFWPIEGAPGYEASAFSDHRLVWLDIRLERPANPPD